MSSMMAAECVPTVKGGGSTTTGGSSGAGVGGSSSSANTSLFVDVGMLLIEGRLAEAGTPRGYKEGPHCPHITNSPTHHICNDSSFVCERASKLKRHMSLLSENLAPMCIDVLLCPECSCGQARATSTNICQIPSPSDLLIEQWTVSIINNKSFGAVNSGGSASVGGGGIPSSSSVSAASGSSSASSCSTQVSDRVLLQALRSQLHFSQLSAWYSLGKVRHVCYRLSHPVGCSGFTRPPLQHNFPLAKISQNASVKVCLKSLPRTEVMPAVSCPLHSGHSTLNATVTVFKSVFAELGQCLLDPPARIPAVRHGFTVWRDSKAAASSSSSSSSSCSSPTRRQRQSPSQQSNSKSNNQCPTAQHAGAAMLDDRMLSGCKHIGKHHCEDDLESCLGNSDERLPRHKAHHNQNSAGSSGKDSRPHGGHHHHHHNIYNIFRCETSMRNQSNICEGNFEKSTIIIEPDENHAASSKTEILLSALIAGGSKVNPLKRKWSTSTGSTTGSKKLVSSAAAKATELAEYFTKLDISHQEDERVLQGQQSAAPLSNMRVRSSTAVSCPPPPPPPPPRMSHPPLAIPQPRAQCWTTDSSSEETEGESPVNMSMRVNRHACYEHTLTTGWLPSPPPPLSHRRHPYLSPPTHSQAPPTPFCRASSSSSSKPLLGSFEENVLNGRLTPTSRVQGFMADLGASGNFCPQHLKLPVTVSFYSLEPYSAPFLGEINIGKKGYTVPRSGTIQLTLLNPIGTVIKMFVVNYDVTDMPANSHTFIRQRTVSTDPLHSNKLRYLIHLRLRSSKSGRVSLMSNIQIILNRQYDVDSSIGGLDLESGSLRSITITPSAPRYSTNK